MKQSVARATVAFLIAVAATAGSSATGEASPPDAPKEAAAVDAALAALTEAVLADAASQAGIDKSSLTVKSAEAVTWADGSLGCPAPGLNYTMAEVPGYRIRVQAGKRDLDYHANRRGYFVLCPVDRATDPVGPVAY